MGINTQNREPIVTSGKEVIYRDIYTFIERVQIYNVVLKKTIWKNLKLYFRGNVFNWHLVQLSEMEQKFLAFNDDEDDLANWTGTLLHQFKGDMSLAQKVIFKKHYTLEDVTHKHKLKKYANQIICNSKFTDFPAYNQLIAIRDGIAVELQQSIPMITKDIHISDILNVINDAKTDWWALEVKFT